MSDKKSDKPVTLSDYISSEPTPESQTKRRKPSQSDLDRLKQLEIESREETRLGSKKKRRRVKVKKRGSVFGVLFWIAILLSFLLIIND